MRLLAAGSLVLMAACAVPAEEVGGSVTSTTPGEAPTTTTPAMEIVSATACKADDPWSMVETAFEGTVVAIEPRVNEERNLALGEMGSQAETDTWQWVTFDVASWYTNDFGTEFSMWAPNFDGTEGETWLIAGALYGTMGQQSGEVFPCVSTPAAGADRSEFATRYGEPVAAGAGVPEGEPDPALLAEIEEHRSIWEAAGIDEYTAVISIYEGAYSNDTCGEDAAVRVTVEGGQVVSAVDVGRFCEVEDTSGLPTIDTVFDHALASAGAITDPIDYDEELGFIRSFYAYDRSVDTGAYIEVFYPGTVTPVLGAQESLDALALAEQAWVSAGVEDYSYQLDVICFCTISGHFEVTVADGEVVEVQSDSGPVDFASPDQFMSYDLEGLFDLAADWGGGSPPDEMLVAFDPELHYPTEVRIDQMSNAIDDELTFFVSEFEPA
jgi:Family of unknown function (DUF6174)